jgi:hypothetical protein
MKTINRMKLIFFDEDKRHLFDEANGVSAFEAVLVEYFTLRFQKYLFDCDIVANI